MVSTVCHPLAFQILSETLAENDDQFQERPSPPDSYWHGTAAVLSHGHPSVKDDTCISKPGPASGQETDSQQVILGRKKEKQMG